eukprot:scaffold636577_cov122-Attheya_sp.AAC.1
MHAMLQAWVEECSSSTLRGMMEAAIIAVPDNIIARNIGWETLTTRTARLRGQVRRYICQTVKVEKRFNNLRFPVGSLRIGSQDNRYGRVKSGGITGRSLISAGSRPEHVSDVKRDTRASPRPSFGIKRDDAMRPQEGFPVDDGIGMV